MPKHNDTPTERQAPLLTILFSVLSFLIWGALLFYLFRSPAISWLRQGYQIIVAQWDSKSDVPEGSLDDAGRDTPQVTPVIETLISRAEDDLEGIVIITRDHYPYQYFLYPVSQKLRLPADYPTSTAELPLVSVGEVTIAEVIKEPLLHLMSAAKGAGFSPYLRSGFRSINDQHTVFSRYVTQGTESGKSLEDARTFALQFSAEPGYSEHHLGLAVDLLDAFYPDWVVARKNYDKGLYQWLRQNAHEFGFVISYPVGSDGGHSKPGSGYSLSEPWHLRFVGVDLATWLYSNGYLDTHSDVTVNGILLEIQNLDNNYPQ